MLQHVKTVMLRAVSAVEIRDVCVCVCVYRAGLRRVWARKQVMDDHCDSDSDSGCGCGWRIVLCGWVSPGVSWGVYFLCVSVQRGGVWAGQSV